MPQAHVLVVNCGSSSIKLALLAPDTGAVAWQAMAERLGTTDARLEVRQALGARSTSALPGAKHDRALEVALAQLPAPAIAGVGHRVVHGGEAFSDSVVIDARAIEAIAACSDLAPLHNPANLSGIREALRLLPKVEHVAVFDTAFHQTMPARAFMYALPYRLYDQFKVRKYGFHGTSHRYVTAAAAELIGRPLRELNLISAHLGNGCSATAVAGGRSVDTTMGLTPLEGLVMGTRSGDVDPNLHAFLVEHAGMDLAGVSDLLNEQSGLLGLSGESNDMRALLGLERQGHARAALAIEVFCYRLAKALLGLSAALPSVDALVFTGGIGENAAPIRERTVRAMSVCGAKLDPALNTEHGRTSRGVISDSTSRVTVLVVPTHEELVIAREVIRLLERT